MNVVWTTRAMEHFGHVVADALGWPLFVEAPLGDVDAAYIIGMYDPPFYAFTLERTARAKRRIIHWCGNDVAMLSRPEFLPEATHLCESAWLADELRASGIDAQVVTFPTRMRFVVAPMPAEPVVSVYYGNNPNKYGANMVQSVMECMSDVTFATYQYGQYAPEEMPSIVAQSSVCLRLTTHDGSANTVREFLEGGRRAVTTTPLPYAKVVRYEDLRGIVAALRVALKETEPDTDAAQHYAEFNRPERFVREFESATGVQV